MNQIIFISRQTEKKRNRKQKEVWNEITEKYKRTKKKTNTNKIMWIRVFDNKKKGHSQGKVNKKYKRFN